MSDKCEKMVFVKRVGGERKVATRRKGGLLRAQTAWHEIKLKERERRIAKENAPQRSEKSPFRFISSIERRYPAIKT